MFSTEIGPHFDRAESVDRVTTTALLTNFSGNHNPEFRIIRSQYDDAPPVGMLTSLHKVNLVRGSMPKAEIRRVREREREEGHDWVDSTIASIPGGLEMEALVSSAHKARKQSFGGEDKDEQECKDNGIDEGGESDDVSVHVGDVGYKFWKHFPNHGWYEGEVKEILLGLGECISGLLYLMCATNFHHMSL